MTTYEGPKGKIAAWVREMADARTMLLLEMTIGDTPIENILFVAIHAILDEDGHRLRRLGYGSAAKFAAAAEALAFFDSPFMKTFVFQTQREIEKYRADFTFSTLDYGEVRELVVECDGHDYHERTKEQAARDRGRDRRMQELGFTVFRFTGSEIYRDPMRCARQVVDWLISHS